jgi:hypothetical protein
MGFRATLPTTKSGDEVKLFVEGNGLQVKVEVNFVFRGTVPSITRRSWAQDFFSIPGVRCNPEWSEISVNYAIPRS